MLLRVHLRRGLLLEEVGLLLVEPRLSPGSPFIEEPQASEKEPSLFRLGFRDT